MDVYLQKFGGFIQWHLAPPIEGEMPTPTKKESRKPLGITNLFLLPNSNEK